MEAVKTTELVKESVASYTIICPNCRKEIRSKVPLKDAEIVCPECGMKFHNISIRFRFEEFLHYLVALICGFLVVVECATTEYAQPRMKYICICMGVYLMSKIFLAGRCHHG